MYNPDLVIAPSYGIQKIIVLYLPLFYQQHVNNMKQYFPSKTLSVLHFWVSSQSLSSLLQALKLKKNYNNFHDNFRRHLYNPLARLT